MTTTLPRNPHDDPDSTLEAVTQALCCLIQDCLDRREQARRMPHLPGYSMDAYQAYSAVIDELLAIVGPNYRQYLPTDRKEQRP